MKRSIKDIRERKLTGTDIERNEKSKLKSENNTKIVEESKDSSKIMLNEYYEKPKDVNQSNLIEIVNLEKVPEIVNLEKVPEIVNLEKVREDQIDLKIKKNKLQQIIDDMSKGGGQLMEFGIVDFVKLICKSNHSRIAVYNYGIENLNEILDIETYLNKSYELELIKQVLFDKDQMPIFNKLSKVIGFKKMFDEKSTENSNIDNYEKSTFSEFFNSFEKILARNNATDEKIINFINSQLLE